LKADGKWCCSIKAAAPEVEWRLTHADEKKCLIGVHPR
jgi:hypothetical protein